MQQPWFQALPLVPLGDEAIDELLDELLGGDASLTGLRADIVERTAGNPFFVEEVVRGLIEEGAVVGDRGSLRLDGSPARLLVPETVHAVLAARIDRLGAEAKNLLQTASVLGREFGEPLLERATGDDVPAVAGNLRTLVEGEFVAADNGGYAFVHPLTQEVAYGSLLTDRRREVHAAVAVAIEELHPDGLDERAALVAHHLGAAGENLPAARWHARAAAWTGLRDPIQSAAHWRRVAELCDGLDETQETLSLGLIARVWILQYDWRIGAPEEDVERVYAEARALADRSDDEVAAILMLTSYAGIVGIGGSMAAALPIAMETLDRAEKLGDDSVWLTICAVPIYSLMVSGEFARARVLVERAIALADSDPAGGAGLLIGSPRAWMRMMRAFLNAATGDCGTAHSDIDEAIRLAQIDGDGETEGWARMQYGQLANWAGHVPGCVEQTARAVTLAEDQGSAFSRAWTRYSLALALEAVGDLTAAVEEIGAALAVVAEHRTGREGEAWIRATLARILVATGDLDGAQREVELADRLVRERGVYNGVPLVAITRARLLNVLGEFERSSAALDEAERGMNELGALGFAPRLWLERADLACSAGDPDLERAALEQALAIAERSHATGHADTARERLAALSSRTAS